jgi:arylsulfatase A-like enzyme
LLAALIAPAACTRWGSDEAAPRLVILYATCTVNCQYLSPYNPGVAYTPHLDAFQEHATVFAKHQTEAGASGVA